MTQNPLPFDELPNQPKRPHPQRIRRPSQTQAHAAQPRRVQVTTEPLNRRRTWWDDLPFPLKIIIYCVALSMAFPILLLGILLFAATGGLILIPIAVFLVALYMNKVNAPEVKIKPNDGFFALVLGASIIVIVLINSNSDVFPSWLAAYPALWILTVMATWRQKLIWRLVFAQIVVLLGVMHFVAYGMGLV